MFILNYFSLSPLDGIISVVLLSFLTAVFFVYLTMSIVSVGFTLIKKAGYLALTVGLSLISYFFLHRVDVFGLILGLGTVLFSVLLLFNVKTEKPKKEQRELARFIDNAIKGKDAKNPEQVEILKAEPQLKNDTVQDKRNIGIDYSHVKNVIKRLDGAMLSTGDRKQVHDLELNLVDAERGNTDRELKSRINEGLGSLLKIMSKYGI